MNWNSILVSLALFGCFASTASHADHPFACLDNICGYNPQPLQNARTVITQAVGSIQSMIERLVRDPHNTPSYNYGQPPPSGPQPFGDHHHHHHGHGLPSPPPQNNPFLSNFNQQLGFNRYPQGPGFPNNHRFPQVPTGNRPQFPGVQFPQNSFFPGPGYPGNDNYNWNGYGNNNDYGYDAQPQPQPRPNQQQRPQPQPQPQPNQQQRPQPQPQPQPNQQQRPQPQPQPNQQQRPQPRPQPQPQPQPQPRPQLNTNQNDLISNVFPTPPSNTGNAAITPGPTSDLIESTFAGLGPDTNPKTPPINTGTVQLPTRPTQPNAEPKDANQPVEDLITSIFNTADNLDPNAETTTNSRGLIYDIDVRSS